MRTLIVLCAGGRMVDGLPLFLQRHPDGKLIAEKAIEGIYPEKYDSIVYTLLKEHDDNFDASDTIIKELGDRYPVNIVTLENRTSGPAETVYKTLKIGNIDGEIVIRDSHNYIKISNNCSGNFLAGLDLTDYEKTIERLREKSFVVLNEQCQVLDVVEKRFCSDVISSGLYGFKKSSDYKLAFERLSDENYPIKKLYISHIISYLIGYKQRVFHSVKTLLFEDWATLNAWNNVQKNYSTCFIDLDAFMDLNESEVQDITEILSKASKKGCVFIAYSSGNITKNEMLIKNFKESGVNVLQIVTGCTYSNSRMLLSQKEDVYKLRLEE